MNPTITLGQLRATLVDLAISDVLPVRLIINGTAYPVIDVWVEYRQEANNMPAVCIGEDPR